MGLTESAKSGKHSNIPLNNNPKTDKITKKRDTRPAYIRKELRKDKKNNFSNVLTNYNLTKTDKEKIDNFLNKKRNNSARS